MIQALSSNLGKVYIGISTINKTTLAGVLAVLPAPASATTGPFTSASFTEVNAPAGFDLQEVWLDVDTSGEGVVISGVEQ